MKKYELCISEKEDIILLYMSFFLEKILDILIIISCMTKNLFFTFFALMMLVACQPKEYKIIGTIDQACVNEKVKVYLSERINRNFINIDSVDVINGKFEFQGVSDSAKVGYLIFVNAAGDRKMGNFILENGNIYASMDSSCNLITKGTKQNDVLALFNSEENEIETQMDQSMMKMAAEIADEVSKTKKDSLESVVKALKNQLEQLAVDYAAKYVNTLVGSHIFMSRFWNFSVAQKETLFAKMNEKTKSISRIKELIEATNVEKQTSEGQHYVDFSMPTLAGDTASLSNFVGKTEYLLIDFWASWCGPCVHSFPELTAFYKKNKGSKFEIVGVSLDKNIDDWASAVKKYKLTWAHLSDVKFWDCEGAKLYAVNSIPSTVLIDKNGVIVGRNLELTEIQKLLNQ